MRLRRRTRLTAAAEVVVGVLLWGLLLVLVPVWSLLGLGGVELESLLVRRGEEGEVGSLTPPTVDSGEFMVEEEKL